MTVSPIFHVNRWGRCYASPSLAQAAGARVPAGVVIDAPVSLATPLLLRPANDRPTDPTPAAPRHPTPKPAPAEAPLEREAA